MNKLVSAVLCFCVLGAASPKPISFPMKYEGGSLPLNQHDKVKVLIEQGKGQITIAQGKQAFAVPVASFTEISYGNDVHRRVGAAIGVGIVTLGIGALMALVKTKKHYVGLTWDDKADAAKRGGVVWKVGKGEYRGFIAALEGVLGLKAVDADAIGSGGTSKP